MCPRGHSWDHPRGHSHLCKPANRGPAQPGGSQPVSVWWSLPFSFSHALFSKHMKLKPWARLVGFSFKHVTQPLPRNLLLVFSQPHLPLVSEHPREGILALPHRCARPSGVPRGPATSTGSLASQRHPGKFPKVPGRDKTKQGPECQMTWRAPR